MTYCYGPFNILHEACRTLSEKCYRPPTERMRPHSHEQKY
jgi:hypothetical protein